MFNLIRGIGYVTLIGLATAVALIAGADNRKGRIVEDPDELGYWWETDADNDWPEDNSGN